MCGVGCLCVCAWICEVVCVCVVCDVVCVCVV